MARLPFCPATCRWFPRRHQWRPLEIRRGRNDRDSEMVLFATNGGVAEVDANHDVHVIVDENDDADSINEAEAEAAFQLAQKLKAEAKDQVSLERLRAWWIATRTFAGC